MKCRYCADSLRVMNEKLLSKIGEKCGGQRILLSGIVD